MPPSYLLICFLAGLHFPSAGLHSRSFLGGLSWGHFATCANHSNLFPGIKVAIFFILAHCKAVSLLILINQWMLRIFCKPISPCLARQGEMGLRKFFAGLVLAIWFWIEALSKLYQLELIGTDKCHVRQGGLLFRIASPSVYRNV